MLHPFTFIAQITIKYHKSRQLLWAWSLSLRPQYFCLLCTWDYHAFAAFQYFHELQTPC